MIFFFFLIFLFVSAERATSATRDDGNDYDLAEHVQDATSTTSQRQAGVADKRVIGRPDKYGDPMKHADRWFRRKPYFGAVDQRYQLESKTTETSSTPRLDAKLSSEASCHSTQMYYILVMTTTRPASDKCHCAGMNEGFEARKQFVMEWEMEFVGLLYRQSWQRSKDSCTRVIHRKLLAMTPRLV